MNSESIIAHIKSLTVEIQHSDFEDIPVLKAKVLSLYEQLVVLEHLKNTPEIPHTNAPVFIEDTEVLEFIEPPIVDEAQLKEEIEAPSIDELIKENIEVIPTEEAPIEVVEEIIEDSDGPELLHELESITEGFELPEFEPAPTLNSIQEHPKSLNEILNKSVQIGLNDRIAFIKHLFEGKQEDYTRVISQINTMENPDEVISFIDSFVKPEYNNWEGKEATEERFVQTVLNRFES